VREQGRGKLDKRGGNLTRNGRDVLGRRKKYYDAEGALKENKKEEGMRSVS